MNQKNKKSSQNRSELEYLFEVKKHPSPIQIHSSVEDMGLVFDPEICQSIKPKITLDSSEDWPVNPISGAWYEGYTDYCRQSPIQIHSNLGEMELAFNAETCQPVKQKITLDSPEPWPVNSIPNSWYESYNDNC